MIKKFVLSFFLICLGGGIYIAYYGYSLVYESNVNLKGKSSDYFYIRTGSDFNKVLKDLTEQQVIVHSASFERLAELKHYRTRIKPGRYRIREGMNNNQLLNMFRAGLQEPITISFNMIRTREQLASRIGKKLEADSAQILELLNDRGFAARNGFNRDNILAVFIPNTYQFYWNTSSTEFLERMVREYKAFWNESRKARARAISLSQTDVSILASIVQAEQSRFEDEKPIIAGLYINRLREGMPLQSDPTLIYAMGDFTITRVLNADKDIASPYNTYKHSGLPPGPICLPEISSLEAVLNYFSSHYIYMCAKEDFSGRHNFSETIQQHSIYARRYREALDKHNIKR
jgi:UPF0755 protein